LGAYSTVKFVGFDICHGKLSHSGDWQSNPVTCKDVTGFDAKSLGWEISHYI